MATIMVVDDSRIQRMKLAKQIQSLGHSVVEANHGRDGLAKLSEFQIDVILTDIHMPEMDGISMLREVIKSHPKLPVVVISADVQTESIEEAKEVGAKGFLTKPADEVTIASVLSKCLEVQSKIA